MGRGGRDADRTRERRRAAGSEPSASGEKTESKASAPEAVGSILDRWLKVHHVRQRVDRTKIYRRWCDVVSEEIAEHTRVVDLQSGTLIVEVNSSALLHELSTYHSEEILEQLHGVEDFEEIREVRWRAGSF